LLLPILVHLVHASYDLHGDLQVLDGTGKMVWHSNTTYTKDGAVRDCSAGCVAVYQNDGNFVLNDQAGG
jgi:hypothetical protein